MIAPDVIEEVRRLVDVVALIGAKVMLRKSGASYVGCCPFHEERQGSFHVYPDDKRFVCYGCGARGDVFEFLQRLEGRPFPAVLRELGAGVGVAVPRARRPVSAAEERSRSERAGLLAACEAAASHWQECLWAAEGELARQYLASRGIREEVARGFRLGYALGEWHDAERALAAAKITTTIQHVAGILAVRQEPGKTGRHYDRFRQRIVFPIEDAGGRVIGFGGRAIGNVAGPKYLNGPETPVYKKARALYGLHRARDGIRRTGKAILVEGYFDVLALHQAGIGMAVACGGTAFTTEQLELLMANGCRELVLLFDGDEAGAGAPARAARAILGSGLTTSVAQLSAALPGSDPDAFVLRFGKASVEEVLAGARPLTEFLMDDAIRRHAGGLGPQAPMEHKLLALRELTPLVLAAPEGLARSTFERAVARRLDIDIGPLRLEVKRAGRVAEQVGGRR